MLNVFKVLAVFTAIAAVGLMAVAISTSVVKPDFNAEMNTPAMLNYTFSESAGENPQWTVTRRFGDKGNVGTHPTGYDAVIAAHKDYLNYLNKRTTEMSSEATALTEQAKTYLAKQSQDLLAMENRITALKADADAVATSLLEKSAKLQGLSVKGREIRDETAQRRTDVLRLQHELEELRTDLYRLTSIRRDLMDRLLRTQIENQELADRTTQLKP
ncbi:MAG: hypothetical protein RLZZ458_885 [Planctomycetota bacterium]|jgi:hypothetical protein